MPKSYRIRTEVGQDKYINVNLEQDWESLEILSLKIMANDLYTRFCADYGVVVGRVFVNNGFGLPNAKVSVFIPLEAADELNPVISELYPYKSITDTNEEGYRYNLLPKLPSYNGHTSTGSFPNKADVLMDNSYIEVYDKYYRFTVTTNESGDFMIFGVPVGTQTIVMDVDLSDIGCFSLAPQDLIQQGLATETQVNGARFKSSTNLRELPQIKNLVFDVDVRPFWGDAELCQVGITRVDFDLTKQANINIQPTAIFMGSIISTTDDDALKVSCKPKNNTGNLCELIAGPGEIQAIRQTIFSDDNGLPILERYQIEQEGKVIDGDGTYLLNVPMNLDYVFTNEFGQQVISNDPSKGIPTKGKYRFKFKWQNEQGLQGSFLRADFLVPNVKEYGWVNSNTDPFDPNNAGTYNYTLAAGQISGFTAVIPQNVGFASPQTTNVESYQILINGQVYLGSIESIQLNTGDQFQIIATPVNPLSPQTISFTSYPQDLFDVYKSYAFSTDWDDYANTQDAIDCEDTFYEFKYNKVYTTAMFLDRYKNGIGRAKHLGIKEIDNRSCKSTVNTFPVNDIIRNFDFIFFVFNILINILTFPILTLLFVAHLIALLWPVLKYLLLFLGPLIVYFGVSAGIDLGYYILSLTNVTAVGPVISPATILQIIAQGAKVLFLTAAGLAFTYFYTKFFINNTANGRIDNFPRIGLPMIAYPDCTSCDCECGNASLDDDFDANSIQQEIQDAQNGLSGGGTGSYDLETTQPSSLIAPLNTPQSYNVSHPNLELNSNGDEPFDCGFGFGGKFESFTTLIGNDDVTSDVVVRAVLDFQRMFSGYDVLSSTDPNKYIQNEAYLLKAPQPFLFSAKKNGNNPADSRFFAFPTSVTLAQKLNEFNTRDKYFYNNTSNAPNTGINKIKTWVNPTINNLTTAYLDQVVVILMNPGTTATLGVGNLITFQDPTFTGTSSTNRLVNLTGATTNQFSNNAITGTTITGTTSVTVTYANPSNPSGGIPTTFDIISPQVSQIADPTNPSVEQSYLQYATDIEYFQLITGMTYSDFNSIDVNTSGYFPETFLRHNIDYIRPNCNLNGFIQETYSDVISLMSDYQNYEVCIFVRGVDPFTAKQTIKYDLSHIFGYTTLNQQVTVEGEYYLNIPIQPNQIKPQSHNTANNGNAILYHPSYTFTIDPLNYTGFTSELPYYYLSTDDTLSSLYTPVPSLWNNNSNSTLSLNQTLINGSNMPLLPPLSFYTVGGTYFRWNSGTNYTLPTNIPPAELFTQGNSSGCNQDCQKQQYYNHPPAGGSGNGPYFTSQAALTATYSPAYYRYSLPGVSFSNSNNIVMRSDRLPTSTGTQNGAGPQTGFGLHQNDNFTIYAPGGNNAPPQIFVGGDLANGESFDLDPNTEALTSTLTCEGMVPLACYSGSGQNVGVLPSSLCSVPSNRMINGCYCLLNKKYVKEYGDDVRLFLEWKVRFTMNFAACRGVFAQVFQNNWVNGVLYMFNFNKQTTFNFQAQPNYDYCQDVILYNDISNTFYYRSSPWNENTQQFVGKNSPTANPNLPQSFLDFPGLGYNQKQIQFPTTVVDLGPRDYFINEICCSGIDGFGSYYADQLKSTSYQDNSDIIQLGFLSRILNEGVRQRILPISNGGNNSEGKGIIQFFNSTRGGYRIDGDWSQMLSINSEWKVSPFITENIPAPNYIYFGDNNNGTNQYSGNDIKPIMGLFFSSNTNEERYRKIMSPGIETYNFNPLIEEKFGYSKSQEVPHYRWTLSLPQNTAGTPNIFGSEDNNWYTDTLILSGQTGFGFTKKRYQDLDFTSPNEKYITQTTRFGFISNFLNNVPDPSSTGVIQGQPVAVSPQGIPTNQNALQSVVVGAPYHFYFGLNNGKTAINRFYKLYVSTAEE